MRVPGTQAVCVRVFFYPDRTGEQAQMAMYHPRTGNFSLQVH